MTWTNRIAAIAGLLLLNGAVAFAAAEMKVDVPFAFATAGENLPAGTYYIADSRVTGAIPMFRIQHAETGKTVIAVSRYNVNRKGAELPAQVAFRCVEGNCVLAEIFGLGAPTGNAVHLNLKARPNQHVAMITIPAAAE